MTEIMLNEIALLPSAALDDAVAYCSADLLKHVPQSLFKRFVKQTAQQCQIPEGTVFLNMVGVFAAVACRRWAVAYATGGVLPIGLYVVTEQPPGTGKSRCHNIAQAPFFKIKSELQADLKREIRALTETAEKSEQQEAELQELTQQKPCVISRPFISNATAEGVEAELLATGGYFSAVSSEQGLFNSLLGITYNQGGGNNNDITLNGFDGGYVSSCRVTREGYHGHVIGGVVMFAQDGSVQKILGASNGTGLAERFLMLCEPHNLGKRDHFKKVHIDETLEADYASRCQFANEIYRTPVAAKDLLMLSLTDSGYQLIAAYRQQIEPHIADGGKFSHVALRGAAAKIDMQILKLAANLWLLTRADHYNPIIPDSVTASAIGVADALLESNLAVCRAKGIIGPRAEFEAILSMFEVDRKTKSERQIIQSRSRVEPFRSLTGNKSSAIRCALADMVGLSILSVTMGERGELMYGLIQ